MISWQVVRRYSEETFSLIADGRLSGGWNYTYDIALIRMEMIATQNMNKVDSVGAGKQYN